MTFSLLVSIFFASLTNERRIAFKQYLISDLDFETYRDTTSFKQKFEFLVV